MKSFLKIYFAPLCLAAFTAACTTFADMEKGLEEFKGKHITDAIATLGYPDGERSILGTTVYIWAKQWTQNYTSPQTSSTVGYVGGTRHTQTTTTYAREQVTHSCKIEFVVDESDIIVAYSIDGDLRGCQVYAQRLTKQPS